MEFFRDVSETDVGLERLRGLLSIHNLPGLCDSIDTVIKDNLTDGVIYCLWGEFRIDRQELKHGIRFSMPGCPNALTWTITINEAVRGITIHCTIDKRSHDPDFIASLELFMDDWQTGLTKLLGESN